MQQSDPHTEDWETWAADWQAQGAVTPPWPALHAEVARRSRRVRLWWIGELLVAMIAIGNCLRVMWQSPESIPASVLWGLIALVVFHMAWVQWKRRHQWRARTLDPGALIAFERTRTQTSVLLWRVSIWISLLLWMALMVWGLAGLPETLPARNWAMSGIANALVVLVFALIGVVLGRRCRRRLERLARLEALLEG
ncbi:hypothetical protein [Pseudoxanthomonas sp. JBR18]|uniref:hypothetical protein n=1 Tax=Pseudoxanthomonas sp. JBR18 TaxID=2969308 RepID=UPI002305240F|nr:hypothetical protein [Pseudoxanthomonas sp. JBR18]WCE05084.1 hypothetical protein PJ250_03640 [Pseudoxanthomonas sp. JBR18]